MMKTYLAEPDSGLLVEHDVDKIYIRYKSDPYNGGDDMCVILLNEEIDAVVNALKRIKADIECKRQEEWERKKLAVWNMAQTAVKDAN
jgi:hypothetical protein